MPFHHRTKRKGRKAFSIRHIFIFSCYTRRTRAKSAERAAREKPVTEAELAWYFVLPVSPALVPVSEPLPPLVKTLTAPVMGSPVVLN